jgi:S-adenosylmethionine hydrolase
MAIITLTSDYGTIDYYVAALKGHLLSKNPDLTIVDVSHQIASFDIVQAAFVLRHAYPAFPEGTIHCILVHNRVHEQRLLLFEHNGHVFLVPDNGVATLMFDEITACYAIPFLDEHANWQQRVAECVNALKSGTTIESMGGPAGEIERRIHLNPVVTNDFIRGSAIYIDNYDNVVFNIRRELFESVCKGREFKLYYKRHDPVVEIHKDYYNVPVGEVICRFNNRGFLELGINMGRAASLLGIKIDDTVQVHFDE